MLILVILSAWLSSSILTAFILGKIFYVSSLKDKYLIENQPDTDQHEPDLDFIQN